MAGVRLVREEESTEAWRKGAGGGWTTKCEARWCVWEEIPLINFLPGSVCWQEKIAQIGIYKRSLCHRHNILRIAFIDLPRGLGVKNGEFKRI